MKMMGYDGSGLNVGLKSMFTDKLELSAGVSFRDLELDTDFNGAERKTNHYLLRWSVFC